MGRRSRDSIACNEDCDPPPSRARSVLISSAVVGVAMITYSVSELRPSRFMIFSKDGDGAKRPLILLTTAVAAQKLADDCNRSEASKERRDR
jgi:hypothetical protein